jgi:hypothetical protein
MIAVICCALAAMLSAILVLLPSRDGVVAGIVATLVFVVLFVVLAGRGYRAAMAFATKLEPIFPRPGWSPPQGPAAG